MAIGDGVSAIASLGVTFGGFGPTAMDGVEASREWVERVEADQARRREQAKRLRDLELARTSKPRVLRDDDGTTWRYVVIDEKFVRINRCETKSAKLEIPASIEGLPVVNISADACAELDSVQEIVCPDTVEGVGGCAFRFCPNLRKVTLPPKVADYKATWFQGLTSLDKLVLPGGLDVISRAILDNVHVNHLVIGSSVHSVEPGAFQHTTIETLEVAEDNPFIKTDGDALYTIDGATLIAIARPVESYEVLAGCKTVAQKACYGLLSLKQVKLPESLSAIERFAFSHSGLEAVDVPAAVEVIEEKAFYHCHDLREVILHEGLKAIRESAFEDSALEALAIPASIERIDKFITSRTNIKHAGPGCTLTIDPACELLFLDGNGGLYRHEEDGAHLVQLMDRYATEYTTYDQCVAIDARAFVGQDVIEEVTVTEGVKSIAPSAFRLCASLRHVTLADSIESIGAFAFLDSNIESIRIPASLKELGENALVTQGAHRGSEPPSLNAVEVAPGNDRFYVTQGMLCRRDEDGDHVVIFSNSAEEVVFPSSIVGVDAYAFNNARGIRYLSLNKELQFIKTAGLLTWCWIEEIHVEVAEPIEGRTAFDFQFPNNSRGIHAISQGIGGASWVNVPGIMAQYDNCLANVHDYNSPNNPESVPIYDQVTRILDRLKDPVLLLPVNKDNFQRILRLHIVEICVDVARHDDRAVIDCLADMGYVNEDNLEEIIMAVGRLQDAAMSGYLLEMKRLRFGRASFDFDL